MKCPFVSEEGVEARFQFLSLIPSLPSALFPYLVDLKISIHATLVLKKKAQNLDLERGQVWPEKLPQFC
jgi:hypothetical protein